ncbi:DCP2-domain-containing protein, partial [Sarocladium strictum]
LDDLCVRFIINLPQEDLSSVARICFQVEEAQWFYEDFIRPLDPTLPSMTLRTFCLRMFQHCPLLASFSVENHTQAFEEFLQYKTRIPVRGAILLNSAMDSTVLVKGWKKGANWSFPRGKINKDEDDLDCAVREVYEETGLDLQAAGLVPKDTKPKYIEISMREQQLRLYVFRDVPMDTPFAPRTRKEISKIEWYKLSELPAFRKKGAADDANNANTTNTNANKFYMVAPFLVPLKKWVLAQKR